VSQEFDSKSKLQKQLQQLQQLEVTLQQEKEFLIKGDPEQVTKISEEKNNLLVEIQALDQQFEQSVQFRKDKSQGTFAQQLEEIEATLIRCKDLNQVNSQIIQQSQLAIERMKSTLLQNHSKSTVTYDNKGKISGGLNSLGIKA